MDYFVPLKTLKNGDYFTKKSILNPKEKQVWVKGDYDRSLKAYECYRFSDINDTCFISGKTSVFTGFIF